VPLPASSGKRVGGVLALGGAGGVDLHGTRGMVHHTVMRLVSELSPAAVVLSAPRRQRVSVRPSLVRWLIGRPSVQAVVVPA
jgi:hypothetical protein